MKRSIFAALGLALLATACTPVPSATKNGTLTKVAQSGIFVKTWEAEIVRGGSFTGGTGVQGAPFDFTISDPVLLAKVKNAFENQQEVRITYHRSIPSFFSSDSNGNFLDSIEVVSEAQGGTIREQQTGVAPQQGTSLTSQQVDKLLDNQDRLIKLLEAKK